MKRFLIVAALVATALPARADEGMWLYNDFPSDAVKAKYGFAPDTAWLTRARLASVRLAGGCSGSFVSAGGLVLTNHHCASECIQQLSTAEKDLSENGFVAAAIGDEAKCPEIEINQLVEIQDVTDRVTAATAGKDAAAFGLAQKAEMSRIEHDCAQDGTWRCDVVTLYHGGAYHLYRYKRYQDVRLVAAPEFRIAFFGGDPDNFTFPRYDLDMSLLRVYENGKPAVTPDFFRMDPKGAREGDLTFVSGHPGRTQRLMTIAQLTFLRDVAFPARLARLAEARGMLTQFGKQSPEARRTSQESLFFVENSYKAILGEWRALLDPVQFGRKVDDEGALRLFVQDPAKAGAWDAIARAEATFRDFYDAYYLLEAGGAFPSDLFGIARMLVRGTAEREKPNEARLREYTDSSLPTLTQRLFSTAPIYPDVQEAWLSFGLTKLRELLTADDPTVRRILGKESPESLATAAVRGTKLADVAVRKALWEGGKAAVDASDDPMIVLARLVDPDARAVRKRFDDEVDSVVRKNSEIIAKAHFEAMGKKTYPDATFSLRLSYGAVKGYLEKGKKVNPVTTLAGAFERHTGKDPFALPKTWLDAKKRLDLKTPFNIATTNDIIGGNSGSPVFNRKMELVGLVFDGNLQSLGGAFWFDESVNRTVAVSSAAILETLKKVYGADRVVKELRK
jgi:hypothetical protein